MRLHELHAHWQKLQEAASRIVWPDRPKLSKDGAPPKITREVRQNKFVVSLEMLELAQKTVEHAYNSLFWGELATTESEQFRNALQHVGILQAKHIPNYERYSSSLNMTKTRHAGKDVYLYPFGNFADLGEIWLVVVGNPTNNHFMTNCQAEKDFDTLLPTPFKAFKYYDAKSIAEKLTGNTIHPATDIELCEKHGLYNCANCRN